MNRLILITTLTSLFYVAPTEVPAQPSPVSDVNITFDFDQWPYPLYEEVTRKLRELVQQYPELAELYSIGKSGEGRDLWVLEITNKNTGPGKSKPGMWMDGNIHAREVSGRQLLMYAAESWLASYGKNAEVTELLDSRTFYILPMFDVDGGEKVLTRHPAWLGHQPKQHDAKDLNGDGYITQMRVKDPDGQWYPSPIDARVMLRVRVPPNTLRYSMGWDFIPSTLEDPVTWEDDLAPRTQRYRIYTEGVSFDTKVNVEPEPANFNRNWSAEWNIAEPGAGPYPFSLPEVRAVADFMTSHRNIFFQYTIHSGGGGRNYLVRPPMSHPFEWMPPEDNDFYTRIGAIWSAFSNGGVVNNNYYAQEVKAGRYGDTMTGFANDWGYMHLGIHSLLPEIHFRGKDYNEDGYVTIYETMRWNDEEYDGKYFTPWKLYKHPVLGNVEIGGPKGMPQGIGERQKKECEISYRFLTHIAGLSPLLRIQKINVERLSRKKHRVVAIIQNQGFLSTYITRNALEIGRDYPVIASLEVTGGNIVESEATQNLGHILGRLAYIRRWAAGADESTRKVEWIVNRSGNSPLEVTVEAWAHKAGRDQKRLTISKD
jgi:hypothetical protein